MRPFGIILIIAVSAVGIVAAVLLLRRLFDYLVDKRIEAFQSDLIAKQTAEIQQMYRQMQEWRHDYRNHIQNIKNRLSSGNTQGGNADSELEAYLDQLADDLTAADTSYKTGNVMVDAMLNSKLSSAKEKNITLNVKARVPKGIKITDVELCSVLGNLLDNALEACEKLPYDKRFIRVYIDRLKGQFYISVQNSSPEVLKSKNIFRTTKQGMHGFGLARIDRIIRKYGGFVNRQSEDGIFATEIMLDF